MGELKLFIVYGSVVSCFVLVFRLCFDLWEQP
jgi:hypothetical protein